VSVDVSEAHARELDAHDDLARYREAFAFPAGPSGAPVAYFCGNSLGLMPRRAPERVQAELDAWAARAVEAHHVGDHPWYRYHEPFRAPLARLVGAHEDEVVLMNGLTVNLHLLMVSFYRPTGTRYKVVMERPAFPSDMYAIQTQVARHGFDPDDAVTAVGARPGEDRIRHDDLERAIAEAGESLALVLVGAVNFFTGQRFELARLARAAHAVGAYAGFDLAHAAGNVPLALHDDEVDFAVWCSYKYLNGGPGAPAGAFVHRRHAANTALPRFGGWWGNDPDTRFRMHLEDTFVPVASADAWQLSNPPILAMAPLQASLDLFDAAGMEALREKSVRLTRYLEDLLRARCGENVHIVTPGDPAGRGCQLSLQLRAGARGIQPALAARGVICDFREPDVLRAAPVPLYNTFHDAWILADVLAEHAR